MPFIIRGRPLKGKSRGLGTGSLLLAEFNCMDGVGTRFFSSYPEKDSDPLGKSESL